MNFTTKIIFHIDLNAFFATVEAILDPNLKTKVFAVGGGKSYFRGGVLLTASYKARKYGIHSGMSITEALKIYPKLLIVPPSRGEYKKYSKLFMDTLNKYNAVVYQASVDEAYMDVTDISKEIHPLKLAQEIQDYLFKVYQLPSSIGIAPTLFLAKMGSDFKKPMGITVMRKRDVKKKLYPLKVGSMYGIGRKTNQRLNEINIVTLEDLMNPLNKDKVIEAIGENAYQSYVDNLTGKSNDVVDPHKYEIPKSISNETTLKYDIDRIDLLKEELANLFDETYLRLSKDEYMCKNAFIKIRYSNFKTTTKTKSFIEETDDEELLSQTIEDLFDNYYNAHPVRLLGLGFGGIIEKKDFKIDRTIFNYKDVDKNTKEKI